MPATVSIGPQSVQSLRHVRTTYFAIRPISINVGENISYERIDHEFRQLPTNIIPQAEETWHVQERDGKR